MRIAILGATSHIAKGLIAVFTGRGHHLALFARSPERVRAFLAGVGGSTTATVATFADVGDEAYDVIINCVGIGSPARLQAGMHDIFRITAQFDDLVLSYLRDHPDTLAINMSSGAAYGVDFSLPVTEESQSRFPLNRLQASEFYGIAKLHSEARHRALAEYRIVDLRVFGYFSRFIDPSERFLACDILSCIRSGEELVTSPGDIVRDYVHMEDLAALIGLCMEQHALNDVFDVYSRSPVTKFQLLDYFAARHGLRYRVDETYNPLTVTGLKEHYYSTNTRAAALGYAPGRTSLETVGDEVELLLRVMGGPTG